MQLYNVDDNGDLIKINKLDFLENDVYLVDDDNAIYIWIGLQVPYNKKEITASIARTLDNEREGSAKILIMRQNREYGSFLAIMDKLKRGINSEDNIERRPEKKLEKPKDSIDKTIEKESEVEKESIGKENDLESQINMAAYYLSQKIISYDELCWILSEKELIIQMGAENISESNIRKKAEEIFNSSCTYDELCWLIAELDILIEKKYFD
jgi:hypothetical protein